jgi:hypothetical protein
MSPSTTGPSAERSCPGPARCRKAARGARRRDRSAQSLPLTTSPILAASPGCSKKCSGSPHPSSGGPKIEPRGDQEGRAAADDCRTPNRLVERSRQRSGASVSDPNCPAANNCVFCLCDSLCVSLRRRRPPYSPLSTNEEQGCPRLARRWECEAKPKEDYHGGQT